MKPLVPIRLLITLAATFATAVALVVLLVITDTALSVWQRIEQTPGWFMVVWPLVIVCVAGFVGWRVWSLFSGPADKRKPAVEQGPVQEQELREAVTRAEAYGVATNDAKLELRELDQRRNDPSVYVAFFGEISSGKSSLIKALVPDAEIETGPIGGTTERVTHYRWEGDQGLVLKFTDMPGMNQADGMLEPVARAEVRRAHALVYVCDGDVSRSELAELETIKGLGKPLIVALNKADLYSEDEQLAIAERIRQRIGADAALPVIPVSAGGEREVVIEHADGRVEHAMRPRPPQVEALRSEILGRATDDPEGIEAQRDLVLLETAAHELDTATMRQRRQASEGIVRRYSRRAMLGALAAVGPGTDVLVQGYLGVSMLKELAAVYGVSTKELDLNRFVELATRRVDYRMNILLAISGNVLKAFPGIGTVTGGLMHSVAYGLIFDSLGRAAAYSLEDRGNLTPESTLKRFEDALGENVESRALRLVELVLPQLPGSRSDSER